MEIKHDKGGDGNPYIDVGNVRVTFVPLQSREASKDWAGKPVLRIQAYKDPANSQALFPGAEFPVRDHKEACELIAAISHLIAEQLPATGD